MSKGYRLSWRRYDWGEVIGDITAAGFSVPDIAKRIRCSAPTLRSIIEGFSEPRYNQGAHLLAMRNAVKTGKMKAGEK